MAVSNQVSRLGLWLLLGALGVACAQSVGCSSKFKSCSATRTCPAPYEAAGAAGEESGGSSGSAGQPSAGTAGTNLAGAAGAREEGGAGGTDEAGAGGAEEAGQGGATAGGGGGGAPVGGGGGDGPTGCNTLALEGALIANENNPNTLLPAGTHGPISPGKYLLTKYEWFTDQSDGSMAATLLVTVSGSVATIQGVLSFGSVGLVRYTNTLTTNDPVMSFYTCEDPPNGLGILPALNMPTPADYTATSTTLALIYRNSQGHGYRLTYTKQ